MPELPEVETVLQSLLPILQGKTVNSVKINHPQVIGWPESPLIFARELTGLTFRNGHRRGKFLIFQMSDERRLIFHLRMTGQLFYQEENFSPAPHTHLILVLSGGGAVNFKDTRRFGRAYLLRPGEEKKAGNLERLGPEPLDPDFSRNDFKDVLKKRSGRIKSLLLNQCFLAGLGNIYVDEILFRSSVHPETPASRLKEEEMDRLYCNMRTILREAISGRGTTFRDYRDGTGQTGDFQGLLQVYGREGQNCPHCAEEIRRKKVAGRSSFFCPRCQKDDSYDPDSIGECK